MDEVKLEVLRLICERVLDFWSEPLKLDTSG